MTTTQHALRTVKANGINIRIAEAGEGPLVLFVHGFPESWYSWRHQLQPLADAGYHAVALDVRGYGGSDAPPAIEAYSMKEITADCAGLVQALGEKTAVIIGHDWGSPIAWNSALLYPDVFRAVGGLSVPYTGRPPAPPTQIFKQIFADRFFYILYFQEPGVAEAELEADVRKSIRNFLYAASGDAPMNTNFATKPKDAKFLDGLVAPEKLPAWVTEEDVDYYVGEFTRSGFRGPLNRYRNMDRDFEELPQLAGAKITQPALFIAGERDGVIAMNPSGIETMKTMVPDLRECVLIPGCGHWTQQEYPKETNEVILRFLKGLDS
jgi:pimeloyl-ACP methyl ester carboxylesterase